MSAPEIEPNRLALYLELVAISRKERTIRPGALMRYPHLLGCPEVIRRTNPNADEASRAVAASQALHAAIASIVYPKSRSIAEVALCSTEKYEGLMIKERVHSLPGISLNVFKYQRGLAFGEIIKFLTREVPVAPMAATGHRREPITQPVGRSKKELEREARDFIISYAEKAAKLHFAGLASSFAYNFDREMREHKVIASAGHGANGHIPLAHYVFASYTDFVYWTPVELFAKGSGGIVDDLPDPLRERLVSLLQRIGRLSPIGPNSVSKDQERALRVAWLDPEMHLVSDIYFRKWCGWYTDVSRAAPLIANSGAFAITLAEHYDAKRSVDERARYPAYKALANYYEFDLAMPIIDGIALKDRVTGYFDTEGPLLTNTAVQ